MKVKDLIKTLKGLPKEANILIASDEEWNNLYSNIELGYPIGDRISNMNSNVPDVVIYGLSSIEQE